MQEGRTDILTLPAPNNGVQRMSRIAIAALIALIMGDDVDAAEVNSDDYTCVASLHKGVDMTESAKRSCKPGDQMMIIGLTDDEAASNVISLICDLRHTVFIDRRKVIACIYRPTTTRKQ